MYKERIWWGKKSDSMLGRAGKEETWEGLGVGAVSTALLMV